MRMHDVTVVGGGAVGLILALSLAKLGYQTLSIEKQPLAEQLKDRRTLALSHSSILLLNNLNIWQALKPYTTPIKHVHASEKGQLGRVTLNAEDEYLPFLGVIVSMADLMQVLSDAIQTVENIIVQSHSEVVALQQLPQGYALVVQTQDHQQTITSKMCIACDGADSFLRGQLGISATVHDYQQDAVVFNIEVEKGHQGWAYERFIGDGVLALLPNQNNTMSAVWTVDRALREKILAFTAAEVERLIGAMLGDRLGQMKLSTPLRYFPLRLVHADALYQGNVLLFGNASHFLHPVSGQGLNLSIRDIGVLYDLIAQEGIESSIQVEKIFAQYADLRKSDHRRTIQITHSLIGFFSTDICGAKSVRNAGIHLLQRLPFMKQRFSHVMMGKLSMGSTLMRSYGESL